MTMLHWPHTDSCTEDTFILLDALEQDANELRDAKPTVSLEIGYALCHTVCFHINQRAVPAPDVYRVSLGQYLGRHAVSTLRFKPSIILTPISLVYLTSDINPRASSCTLQTGRQNKVRLTFTRLQDCFS